MAVTDTLWAGTATSPEQLYLQSGQFTSTIKTSLSIMIQEGNPTGVCYDLTNTPFIGHMNDKMFLNSGQFTSTVKDSLSTLPDDLPTGISYDGTNTPWSGYTTLKLFIQSGQFNSTIKDSVSISGIDTNNTGMTVDDVNSPWCGFVAVKLYLQSGQLTSTLKTSQSVSGVDSTPLDIGWDGINTLWCGDEANKLYLQSGQFTSTLKTSEDISVSDTSPQGIESNDVNGRLNVSPDLIVYPVNLALSGATPAPTFTGVDVVFVASALSITMAHGGHTMSGTANVYPATLSLGLLQEGMSIVAGEDVFITVLPLSLGLEVSTVPPTILGDAILLLPDTSMILLALGLSTHAPTINITNDIKILVTNTRNFAITEYSNFAFNSMCQFNGKYLYAKSDGIYEGGGNNDNGTQIVASYKTGAIDTYTTEIQRLRDAYLTFRSDGDVQLFSVGDEINARAYFITSSVGSTIHERRVKFERGIKDRHFNIGISNVNGSTLEVDSIKVLTEPIRKRR